MTVRIEWNDAGLRKLQNEVARSIKQRLERDLNGLSRRLRGQDLAVIRPAVRRAYRTNGATVPDFEMEARAADVQAGRQIVVVVR